MSECCLRIDDFLDGDLSADERAAWLALARDCPHCQEIVAQQQAIDAMLCSAWAMVESPADERSLPATCRTRDRWSYAAMGALATAAALAVAAFVAHRDVAPRPLEASRDGKVVVAPSHPPSPAPPAPQPASDTRTLVSSPTGLMIPIASEPEFTIVRYVPALVPDGTGRDDSSSDLKKDTIP